MEENNSKINDLIKYIIKKSGRKLLKKLLIPAIVIFLFIGGALTGTGIISVFNIEEVLGNFYSFFSLQGGIDDQILQTQWGEDVTAGQLLDLLEQGFSISKTEETMIKIKSGNFKYLLEKCRNYENLGKRTRAITVQGYREYLIKVVTTSRKPDGSESTEISYEPADMYIEKEIIVSNKDTEGMLTLDWRLLYMYSMICSLDRKADNNSVTIQEVLEESDGWYITKRDIDAAYKAVTMTYIYDYDVMADTASYFAFDTCISMPHESEIYGDADTTSGRYTWYYPRSLMSSAVSGYSSLNYLINDGKVVGIQEIYDDTRFQKIGETLCPLYTYEFFTQIFTYMPGGKKILDRFASWRQQAEGGNTVIYTGYFMLDVGAYPAREGVTVDGNFISGGGIGYPIGNYSTIGEAAVAVARSRLHWRYSQNDRMKEGAWDCSSMISRIYNELGLDITASGTTLTLKSRAVKYNQMITEADLMPGDAIWYRYKKSDGTVGRHVVMYSGNGNVIHAKGIDYGTVEQPLANTSYKGSNITEVFFFRPYLNISSTFVPWGGGASQITAAELYGKSQEELIELILALAVDDAKKSNILPSIAAAQFILESGWGKSALAQKANNGFGMKTELSGNTWSGSTWDNTSFVEMSSKEELPNGIIINKVSKFRAYQSINDSFTDHSAYLYAAKKGSELRYAGLTSVAQYSAALDILVAGGYATDTKYKSKLTSTITAHNLDRYDGSFKMVDTGNILRPSGKWQNGQKIPFNSFAGSEYAEFSKINSGAAIHYTVGNPNGKVVCINAGHGTSGGSSVKTQSHPDGSGKYTSGTNGKGEVMSLAISSGTTHKRGTSEAAINLKVAKKVKEILLLRGYDIVMIRETSDQQLDNIARTVIANNTSDVHIALHFDSTNTDKGCFYMSVANNSDYRAMEPVKSMWKEHERLGTALVDGMVGRGVKKYGNGKLESDLTQTSYSRIPSVDIEYGDTATDYSDSSIKRIAEGICDGIDAYFGF